MDTTLTPAEVAALSKDMDAALLGNAEDGTAAEGIARTAGMSVNELRKVLPDLPGPKAGNTRTSNNNNNNINGDNDDDDEDYPQPQEEEGDGYVFVCSVVVVPVTLFSHLYIGCEMCGNAMLFVALTNTYFLFTTRRLRTFFQPLSLFAPAPLSQSRVWYAAWFPTV